MSKMFLALMLFLAAVQLGVAQDSFENSINMALHRPAWQASTWKMGAAERAVDGDDTRDWWEHSCTCTEYGRHQWWAVDLGGNFNIEGFSITNRDDEYTDRLGNFRVYATNTKPTVDPEPSFRDSGSMECLFFSGAAEPGQVITGACPSGTQAQYFVVQLMSANSALNLCEVEVYGDVFEARNNLALNQPTWQASTWKMGAAERAVDGDDTRDWWEHSCTCTEYGRHQWWTVDLGRSYDIKGVSITNRDDEYTNRLANFRVYATTTAPTVDPEPSHTAADSQECFFFPGAAGPGEVIDERCPSGTQGQYVVVQLMSANSALNLCEVEVYAD